jgi:hypothetical protein
MFPSFSKSRYSAEQRNFSAEQRNFFRLAGELQRNFGSAFVQAVLFDTPDLEEAKALLGELGTAYAVGLRGG